MSSGHLHDTIRVNLKCHLDLRDAARRGRDVGEVELAKKVVVLRQGAFTLEDLDEDGLLVIGGGSRS